MWGGGSASPGSWTQELSVPSSSAVRTTALPPLPISRTSEVRSLRSVRRVRGHPRPVQVVQVSATSLSAGVLRAPPGVGGSRTQGPGESPQREGREPGRSRGGLWLFVAEPGRPPEAFPTFQKFLGTGGRRGTPYIDLESRERRRVESVRGSSGSLVRRQPARPR